MFRLKNSVQWFWSDHARLGESISAWRRAANQPFAILPPRQQQQQPIAFIHARRGGGHQDAEGVEAAFRAERAEDEIACRGATGTSGVAVAVSEGWRPNAVGGFPMKVPGDSI